MNKLFVILTMLFSCRSRINIKALIVFTLLYTSSVAGAQTIGLVSTSGGIYSLKETDRGVEIVLAGEVAPNEAAFGWRHVPYPISEFRAIFHKSECTSIFQCQSKGPLKAAEEHLSGQIVARRVELSFAIKEVSQNTYFLRINYRNSKGIVQIREIQLTRKSISSQ